VKKFFVFLSLLLLTACGKGPAIDDQTYPWQIKKTAAGNTQVFGIELDKTPLGHAARVLKVRYELGLFESKQGELSLEAFFNEVTRGGLSGKLIVLLDADQQQLQIFRANSLKGKPQESGEIKYRLIKKDQKIAEQLLVSSLSYIPYVNLDKEMINNRFGPADEEIKSKDGLTHYLYMEKGLDIIYSEDGKEVLQYVSPRNMKQLLQPLRSSPGQ
jgi:hypothetical protein